MVERLDDGDIHELPLFMLLVAPLRHDFALKVHGGGKRLQHEFRALYDFYGKRVDYGEGEFPSYWPTDMAQASPPFDGCERAREPRV